MKAELKSLRVKVDLLEARNIENVELLTTKISKKEEEIAKLKATIDAKQGAAPFDDKRDRRDQNNDKQILSGHSSTRALAPSSCRELSLIGHTLDGLYLVQNVDTKKIETVLCNFGTSGKFKTYVRLIDKSMLATFALLTGCVSKLLEIWEFGKTNLSFF